MGHIRVDLSNTNNKWVEFLLINVDTFIICVRFGLTNVDTIRTLTRDEHNLSTRIATSSLKVPEPNGLHINFYQKYWKIFDKSVCKMVKAFFYNGHIFKEINITIITLILKSDNLESKNNFRPVSFSNACYKIIAKILANRLQHLLNIIIFTLQGHLLQIDLLMIILY